MVIDAVEVLIAVLALDDAVSVPLDEGKPTVDPIVDKGPLEKSVKFARAKIACYGSKFTLHFTGGSI